MTCVRPPEAPDYLSSTLDQLDAEGANLCDEKRVVVDGPSAPRGLASRVKDGWIFKLNNQRTGHRLAMWRTFMLALERKADWLIFCEDDLNVAPNAIAEVVKLARQFDAVTSAAPEPPSIVGFHTFFDRRFAEGTPPGIHYLSTMAPDATHHFCGTQCFLIRREVMEYLVTKDVLVTPPFHPTFHAGDFVMAYHLHNSPWPNFGVVIPTLVDHLGDWSACETIRPPVRGNNFAGQRDQVWHDLQKPFYGTNHQE